MLITMYKTKEDALENCPSGHKIILEGNATRRWRVVTDEEYGRIIARGKTSELGSDTQTRSGNFLQ